MISAKDFFLVVLLLIILSLFFYWLNGKMKEVNALNKCIDGFLITKDYQAEQFRFDVNTPITKNLKSFRKGQCLKSSEFIIRKNSGQEEKVVTYDGFDITEAGKLTTN